MFKTNLMEKTNKKKVPKNSNNDESLLCLKKRKNKLDTNKDKPIITEIKAI